MAPLARLIGKLLLVTLTVGTAIVAGQAFYARFNPHPESVVSYPAGSRVPSRHPGPVAKASTPEGRGPAERAQPPPTSSSWPNPRTLLARLPRPAGDREEVPAEELRLALIRLQPGARHDGPRSGDG